MRAAKRVRVELRTLGSALPRSCGLAEMHEAMCRAHARERWARAEKERASARERMRARKELLRAQTAP